MWIMAHPAGKIFMVQPGMYTFFIFRINTLKMVIFRIGVPLMAIHTSIFQFHSKLTGMRKGFVLIRMTINAFEAAMIGVVIFPTIDDKVRVHPFFNILLDPIVIIVVFMLAVAL